MKIKSILVKNFKSIREAYINTSSFNVFVGQNNHGKTNLFQAIEWRRKIFSVKLAALKPRAGFGCPC